VVTTAGRAEAPDRSGAVPTRRERTRAATVEEIKATALQLMREQGTTDVRFTDIARAMGLTAPALYRYFADRDELLTALISEAYGHLGGAIAAERDAVPEEDVAARWMAAATAYRDWARREPQQFALILGLPVPGYVAPEDGATTEAARNAMAQLSDLFVRAAAVGRLGAPLLTEASPAMAACAHEKHPELDGIVPPESFQAMMHAWATLHGVTCLDAYGQLDWMTSEARDSLFASTIRTAALAAGIPVD
jgi:AcrR family transcriptional regulator